MDLGLYNMKYPARRLLQVVLPLCRRVSPNALSLALLPVGAATAACYALADGHPAFWGVGAALILARMALGTLDGLVAVHFDRCSPRGELVNRLAPELCDAGLLAAIALVAPVPGWLAVAMLASAWLTTFAGLLPLAAGLPGQSVGPVGQTDRLAALLVLSVAGAVAGALGYALPVLPWFCAWCVIGGVPTIALRLARTLRAARGEA